MDGQAYWTEAFSTYSHLVWISVPESDGGGRGAEDKARDRDLYQLRITFRYKEKQVERTVAETEWGDSVYPIQQEAWKWARAGTESTVLLASVLLHCP